MRIRDVMTTNVIAIAKETEVGVARERLQAAGIDHLLVLDRKKIVGVIAGKDLLRNDDSMPVSRVMSRDVVTIEPDATIRHAAGVMRGRDVSCLPVVDEGRLAGIVTTTDLLTALSKGEIHAAPPPDRVILRKRGDRKRAIQV